MSTNARAVSAQLRRAGFLPIPDRRREGLYVSGSLGRVHVSCTIDAPNAARRMSADAETVLAERGYTVTRFDALHFAVTKES